MLGQLGRRTRRQSESNRKESREHLRILKIKRTDGATERRSDGNRLAVRTFLKPAHTWNRHASLKHFIEQNDESPRGHPGHSTMARPSGPNAGSAHVLRARITQNVQKVKGSKAPYRKRGPASSVPADRPDVALDFLANAVGRHLPRLVLVRHADAVPHVEAAGAGKITTKRNNSQLLERAPSARSARQKVQLERARRRIRRCFYRGSIPTTRPRQTTTVPSPIRNLLVTLIPFLAPSLELASPIVFP